jgi:hypothetical protein
MRHWQRSKPVARLGVVVVVVAMIAVLAIAFMSPPPHEVHSPGSSPLRFATFVSDQTVGWETGGPSQSLADMHCIFHIRQPVGQSQQRDANSLSNHFPALSQQPHVLYLIRPQCIWIENGHEMRSLSFSADFLPATRALVIHCYAASASLLIPISSGGAGTRAAPTQVLLVIPTSSMGAGDIKVSEEDRLERWLGDESTTFQIGTATIASPN